MHAATAALCVFLIGEPFLKKNRKGSDKIRDIPYVKNIFREVKR